MCHPGGRYGMPGAWGCDCGCGYGFFFRRFTSRKEEKETLEGYRDQLKKELEAVQEHIDEIKKS